MNPPGPRAPRVIALRLVVLASAGASLLLALWVGLVRLGWVLPLPRSELFAAHGPLMVCGFIGTLICLERAVGAGRLGAYLPPMASAAGAVSALAGAPAPIAAGLFTAAGVGLFALTAGTFATHRTLFHAAGALGALGWLAGNALWYAGWPLFRVVPFWMAFLVLTIVGERLELSRLTRPTLGRAALFAVASVALIAGVGLGVAWPLAGARVFALGLIAFVAWLFRYDLARRTVRLKGLTRFIAACLLAGYVWLAIAALVTLRAGVVVAGPDYDAVLHAVFIGFTLSMIFGHASIVFPAILGRTLRYSPRFWVHLGLLQLSLAARIGADLAGAMTVRRWAGAINEVAVLVFLANTALSLRGGERNMG